MNSNAMGKYLRKTAPTRTQTEMQEGKHGDSRDGVLTETNMLLEMTSCFEMDGEHVSDEFHLVLTKTTGCTGASITAQIKENIPWPSDCVTEMTEGNGRLCQHRFSLMSRAH